MALIKCPECGREVSDKAPACPNCGYPLDSAVEKDTQVQKIIVDEKEKSKEKKKIPIIPVIIIICIMVCGIGGGLYYNKIQTKEKEDKQYNSYVDNLTNFGFMAESGEILSCDLLDNITKIWYNSIYEEDSYFTDQYTKDGSGNFWDDFNTSLMMYMFSDSYKSDESDIKECKKKVEELYKKLKDAPEGFEKSVDKAAAVQAAYSSLVDFSLDVEGNYTSVSEDVRNKKEEFEKAYTDFKLSIPEKRKTQNENQEYDFRKVQFGMSLDDVVKSEKDNYDLDLESYSYVASVDDVEFDDELKGNLNYSFDTFRFLSHITLQFSNDISEKQIKDYFKKIYGDNFDGKKLIKENGKSIVLSIYKDDDETRAYLDEKEDNTKTNTNDEKNQ